MARAATADHDGFVRAVGLGRTVFRLQALALIGAAVVIAGLAYDNWQLRQDQEMNTFVVVLDETTSALAVRRSDGNVWTPQEGFYVDFAAEFIKKLATRPASPLLREDYVTAVRNRASEVQAQRLNEWLKIRNEEYGNDEIDVRLSSATLTQFDRDSATALVTIRWKEWRSRNGSVGEPRSRIAEVVIEQIPPTNSVELGRNATQLYVTDINIQEEFDQ